jgi:flagellar assembly factor FliW
MIVSCFVCFPRDVAADLTHSGAYHGPFRTLLGQHPTMGIATTRFGSIDIVDRDIITFVDGMIGMEMCQRWTLLADVQNSALGWLQSVDRPDVALAVVSPRRFVSGYRVRVSARELEPLKLPATGEAQVLVIVTKAEGSLALNLKAPVVINVEKRLGRQIVAKDDHPVQYLLEAAMPLRKTA